MIYLLSILSLLLSHPVSVHAANAALCFLTQTLLPETLEFARQLAQDAMQYDVEIFIMIDDNNFNVSNINSSINLQLLQISNELCLQYNYQKTIYMGWAWGVLTSWDKALFYFNIINKNHSFVWLSEHDVFFPSTQAFLSLHELYSNTSDFIVTHVELNLLGNASYWHWRWAVGQLIPPWAWSMVNVIGLSRRLLTIADQYIQWLGRVPFHEYFFHTISLQSNFTIVTPTELSTDVYSTSYSYKDINRQPNNLWHPLKHLGTQKQWRERLANESLINKTNADLTIIEALCYENPNMTSVEEYLQNLLVKFEICKSKYSAKSRRLLRQRFSNLAEQCQKRNASKEIVSLAMNLADHAYKLPEPPVEVLVTEKSQYHIKLEQALEENKKSIYQLPWNSSSLIGLRNQTRYLIEDLTSEIQREYKERQEFEKQTKLSSTSSLLSSSSTTTSTATTFQLSSSPTTTSTAATFKLSFSSTITSTAATFQLFSSAAVSRVDKKRGFYRLLNQNGNQILGSFEYDTKILLLISFIFCILFLLLIWKKAQCKPYFKRIFIWLFLFLIGVLYDTTCRSQWLVMTNKSYLNR